MLVFYRLILFHFILCFFLEVLSNGHSTTRPGTKLVDRRIDSINSRQSSKDVHDQRPSPTMMEMRSENARPSSNMIDVGIGDLRKVI